MIKKYLLLVSFIVCFAEAKDPFSWINTLPKPWTLNDQDFEYHLKRIHEQYSEFNSRLIAINLWRVGTPYGLYCLGEENEKDNDPIIRYDSSDCTVHVLTTLAYANTYSLKNAKKSMIEIHYKPNQQNVKVPSYNYRWHFTSDRILNHPMSVNITDWIIDPKYTEQVDIELNKKHDGELFLDIDWSLNETISYIPTDKIDADVMKKLPPICGIAFVKKDYFKLGIVMAHEGYVLNRSNLVHASSELKKTVNVDLLEYIKQDGTNRFDGAMFFKLAPIN